MTPNSMMCVYNYVTASVLAIPYQVLGWTATDNGNLNNIMSLFWACGEW